MREFAGHLLKFWSVPDFLHPRLHKGRWWSQFTSCLFLSHPVFLLLPDRTYFESSNVQTKTTNYMNFSQLMVYRRQVQN